MSYTLKDVFYLDSQVNTGTSAGDAADALDLSAYVDPIAKGRSRGVGLAIYKVHFDVVDDSENKPVAAGTTGQIKIFVIAAGSATVDVTPNSLLGSGTKATLNAIGETVVLLYTGSAWTVIGGNGYAVS